MRHPLVRLCAGSTHGSFGRDDHRITSIGFSETKSWLFLGSSAWRRFLGPRVRDLWRACDEPERSKRTHPFLSCQQLTNLNRHGRGGRGFCERYPRFHGIPRVEFWPESRTNPSLFAADSIVSLRNTIVHGGVVGLTFGNMKRYYNNALKVLELVEKVVLT